jgi:hypothetical protein
MTSRQLTEMSHVFLQTGHSSQRPDWLAGHVGLELRNDGRKYRFEMSHRFPVIQPNSGLGDYSRSSCGLGRDACAGVGHSLR